MHQGLQLSLEVVAKILKFLAANRKEGIVITCEGDLSELLGWTDAGYAGADTKSQNGLVVTWGGSRLEISGGVGADPRRPTSCQTRLRRIGVLPTRNDRF